MSARGGGDSSWTGIFMALLLGAGTGVLAFGVAWSGLRWFGCPASLAKGLSVLAGLAVGVLVFVRLLPGRRAGDRWGDSSPASGPASAIADVLDAVDSLD